MDLDTLIVPVFCWLDETLPGILAGPAVASAGTPAAVDRCGSADDGSRRGVYGLGAGYRHL